MPEPLRVKVKEYGEQQLEALGLPPKMEFELANGSIIELTHPWLWSDEVRAAVNKVESGADLDRDDNGQLKQPPSINGELAEPHDTRLARAVLGTKEHARFLKGGGKSGQIALAIELMKRPQDDSNTEDRSDPKDAR